MQSRRHLIGVIGATLLLAFAWRTAPFAPSSVSVAAADVEEATLLENARTAVYLDPRLFAADADYYKWTNIFVHAKVIDIEQKGDSSVGPYAWIYAVSERRDSDTKVPLVIEITDSTMQFADSPLVVDECYRFYGYVGSYQPVLDPATGAELTLPTVNGYHFELVAHDGFGSCESP